MIQVSSPENNAPHIALIGGGTGSFTLLQELKDFTPNISAIVNMSDDGGSTGRLRDEHGVLPPGDVRQCLVALSALSEVRDLFSYRFKEGKLGGHSVGNILLTALEIQHGFEKAVEIASKMLNVTGEVIPVTTTKHDLVMQDGIETVRGESEIGRRRISSPEARVFLDPPAEASPKAVSAIAKADIVAIAPGNFYGSLLPTLAVDGIADALAESRSRKVMIANLVTKPGQTDGWHVVDYLRNFERYVGSGVIDTVLYNTAHPSDDLLAKYAEDGEFPVDANPSGFDGVEAELIGADLLSGEIAQQHEVDIKRTLIRHNSRAVGRQLMKLYYS